MKNVKDSLVNEIVSQAIDIINKSGNILKMAISVFRFCYNELSRSYDMSEYDIYLSSNLFQDYPEDESFVEIFVYLIQNKKLFQDEDEFYVMSEQKKEIYNVIIWNIFDIIVTYLKPKVHKDDDTLKDITKLVLKAIGTTGSFDREGIFDALLTLTSVYNANSSRENVDRPIKELIEAGFLEKLDINNPINPKYYIYRLTENGRSKFRDLFKAEPVKAQFDRPLPEIGSIEHFIGVHELSKLLRKSSMYDEVLTEKARCKFNLGYREYYPDIICKVSGNVVDIFEYETGANTDEFTLDKITKAMSTRHITNKRTVYLNVLTNSQENVNRIKEKADESLRILHSQQQTVRIENNRPVNNIVIQISTVYNIRGAVRHEMSLHDKRVWLWRSDCRYGVGWINGKLPYKQNAQKKNLPNQPDRK